MTAGLYGTAAREAAVVSAADGLRDPGRSGDAAERGPGGSPNAPKVDERKQLSFERSCMRSSTIGAFWPPPSAAVPETDGLRDPQPLAGGGGTPAVAPPSPGRSASSPRLGIQGDARSRRPGLFASARWSGSRATHPVAGPVAASVATCHGPGRGQDRSRRPSPVPGPLGSHGSRGVSPWRGARPVTRPARRETRRRAPALTRRSARARRVGLPTRPHSSGD